MQILGSINRSVEFLAPITRSIFVQGLACIVVLYMALTLIPKQLFQGSAQSDPDTRELLSKIPRFLSSPSSPDVVLMGSSLLIAPALCCDQTVAGVRLPPPGPTRGYQYDKAHFLQRLLLAKTGRKTDVFNFAIPATMMSDQCLLLEESLASGKRPRVIVFGVAPRDFVANDQPVPEATPIAKEVFRIRGLREGGWQGQMSRLADAVLQSIEDSKQKLSGGKSKLEKEVLALTDRLAASRFADRPARVELPAAVSDRTSTERIDAKTEEQMAFYRRIYNPYDAKIFYKQRAYLERALKAAAAAGVPVLVVNMPLSRANTALLDEQAMATYLVTLESVTEQQSVPYLDFGSDVEKYFSAKDFSDSVHLGPKGGKKFFAALSQALIQDPRLGMQAFPP